MTSLMYLGAMVGTLVFLGGGIALFAWLSERLTGNPLPGFVLWGFSMFALSAHFMGGGNWTIP